MTAEDRVRSAGGGAPLPFTKMSGGGNDFIVVEAGAAESLTDLPGWVRRVCRRGMSVGADGVLVVDASGAADIRLEHYNADGGRSSLCGNGTRCAARWALLRGLGDRELVRVHTDAGPVDARPAGDGRMAMRLGWACEPPETRRVELADGSAVAGFFLDVGVPHFILAVPEVSEAPVCARGAEIRRHPAFAPEGTNVSFVAPRPDRALDIRTYERGVEGETLACGTACVAASVVAVAQGWTRSPVVCHPRSAIPLVVEVESREGQYVELTLSGDARVIYEGALSPEAVEDLPPRTGARPA